MYQVAEGKRCVIYIRVSSERQIKGFSLDGQKHYLSEWAKRQGMTVAKVYVEEGKSGKSIQGRTEFQTMLDEIKDGALGVSYVIVFKLSRFGRNAKDILNSLELIMQYGVHLLCVEDGLDSSNAMGKLMITILGAVAEMERENIIAQSYLGREEKARSGGWNGGMAPYGYQLDKEQGKLVVVEGQKEIVQLIYNKFIYENMSYTAISAYLNRNGYKREPAKNATKPSYGEWSTEQIKRILSNPLYTGHIAYGRRRTEKVEGTENGYHAVKQREFIRSEKASHEAIISEEDFARAQEIKAMRAKKGNHNIGQAKAHLLSGIARCPQCGAPMYISTTRWVNEDGTERHTESYVCSYAMKHHGTSVCKRNGIVAEVLEKEVMEFTGKLLRNPKFVTDIEEKIQSIMDFSAVENSIRRRADMAKRLDNLYTEIYKTEDYLEDEKKKLEVLKDEKMNIQTIYGLLWSFDKIYDRMTREERRSLVKYLIAEVETNTAEDRKKLGRCCKSITYRLPIEKSVLTEFANSGVRVESVVLLERSIGRDTDYGEKTDPNDHP